jgi:hypothetical protein
MPCSSSALQPASTNAKPSVEPIACWAITVSSPRNPEFVTVTNVVPSARGVNSHSTAVGSPYADHSIRMRRSGSIAVTVTCAENPYISQSQVTGRPASSRPLPRVNQNREVMAGSTNASKTSATGRRMSISAFATSAARSVIGVASPSAPPFSRCRRRPAP